MALPGLTVNVLDGNLNLQQGSNAQTMLFLGMSLGGTANTLYSFGDQTTLASTLVGGEGVEAAASALKVSAGPAMFMPLNPTTRGGVSAPVKVGSATGALALSIAPQSSITITCTTAGALGTAAFTFALGSGAASAPVTSAAGWSSTGYLVPGTYTTVVFVAGSYVAGGTPDVYTISAAGVVAHPTGAGPAVPTFTASPVDYYTPTVTVVLGGALGTMQFTYSLDGTSGNTSAAIVSSGSGVYAIPNTGIVLTFSATFTLGDLWTFKAAGPTFTNTDLTNALTALQTTYLSQATYAMVCVIGSTASAAAWGTQAALLESAALTLFNSGIYVRFILGCPTVNTILPNAGSVTVDSADTDSVVIAARQAMSAPHVLPVAGDCLLVSSLTGLSLRRNAVFPIAARSARVEASKNIGALADGGLNNVTLLYRDENATQGFDAAGITSLRTLPGAGANGFYVTDAHTGALSTSDYYPFTNARVIDRACGVARVAALPYVLAKLPTTTKGANVGVITEKKAQQIDSKISSALNSALVASSPQDAVSAAAVTNRTNNVLGTSTLIIAVSVAPFAYGRTVTVNVGMQIAA